MTNQQLCERASAKLGIGMEITPEQARHAVKVGGLTNVRKRGGWYTFDEHHVDQLADHIRRRSRKYSCVEGAA